MKLHRLALLIVTAFFFLSGCQGETTDMTTHVITTEPDIENCEYQASDTYGDELSFIDVEASKSTVLSNTTNFICPGDADHPLVLSDSIIQTHQVILSLDAIYPIHQLILNNQETENYVSINEISIELSMDGYRYERVINNYTLIEGDNFINMDDKPAKKIKLIYDDQDEPVGIQDLKAILGEGFIIKEEKDLSDQFLRTEGWTGADGIFTFDLDQGGDRIGLNHQTTGFIFSDTFIGTVNEEYRRTGFEFVNNSFGYLNHDNDQLSFEWDDTGELPKSVLIPDAYIGSRVRNLLDGDGLTITNHPSALLTNVNEGTMWLSTDLDAEVLIDVKDLYDISSIFIWNYNETPEYGVKAFDLYTSIDGDTFSKLGSYQLDQANDAPYTKELIFNQNTTRYLKLVVTDTYDETYVGLGKIRIFSSDGRSLFGDVIATNEITDLSTNEESARLWIQDGIVINDKVYFFPILVKDYLTYFQVHNVGLVEMDIVDHKFDYQHATYMNTPLMVKTSDGAIIYFGAGVMDNRDVDGYIYVYGYKDLDGRKLVVSRVTEENFLDFNKWTYYNGSEWTTSIDDVQTLKDGVSAELSVTYMEEGIFEGKYMLVSMENTTSGNVVFSIGDTPYGPFSEFTTIYKTYENQYLDAFTYNAKLHPNLSTYDRLIISYNVNSTGLAAFRDARIYYPRFISMTRVKTEGEQ